MQIGNVLKQSELLAFSETDEKLAAWTDIARCLSPVGKLLALRAVILAVPGINKAACLDLVDLWA